MAKYQVERDPDLQLLLAEIHLYDGIDKYRIHAALDAGHLNFADHEKFQKIMKTELRCYIKNKAVTLSFSDLFYSYLYSSYKRIDAFFDKADIRSINMVITRITEDLTHAAGGSLQFRENIRLTIGIYCYILAKYFCLHPETAQENLTILQNFVSKIVVTDEKQSKIIGSIKSLTLDDNNKYRAFIFAMVIISGQIKLQETSECCEKYLNYEDTSFMCQFIDYEPDFFVAHFANNPINAAKLLKVCSNKVIEKIFAATLQYLQNKTTLCSMAELELVLNAAILLHKIIDSGKLATYDNKDVKKSIFSLIKIVLPMEFFNPGTNTHDRCQQFILAIENVVMALITKLIATDESTTANFVDAEQRNLLHYVSRRNSHEFVKFLLEHGAQLGQTSTNGENALFALFKESSVVFLDQVAAAVNTQNDTNFLANALVQFYTLFNELEKFKQHENLWAVIPCILSLINKNNPQYTNLSLQFGDVSLWSLSRYVGDSILANSLVFQMYKESQYPLQSRFLAVLNAIIQVNPELANDCLVAFLKTFWGDDDVQDYHQLWNYLATHANWPLKRLIDQCASDLNLKANVFAARLSREHNPFQVAVENKNMNFLVLVFGLFKNSNNLEIALKIGNAAAAMINSAEDIDLLAQLQNACAPRSYWNLPAFKGRSQNAFDAKVLYIIQKHVAKIRTGCSVIYKSKKSHKLSS